MQASGTPMGTGTHHRRNQLSRSVTLGALVLCSVFAVAETCQTGNDVEASTRAAVAATALRFFEFAAAGDTASLRQNAIPSLAADFGGVEAAVRENQPNFINAKATPRPVYVLKQDSNTPAERAEFLCGVFGAHGQTSDSVVFVIPNLPPGVYSVVVLDVLGGHGAYTLSFVLKQQHDAWSLGGLYAQPASAAGHDAAWFLTHARDFKLKRRPLDAWLYYLQAQTLLAPVPFMTTLQIENAYDEAQTVKPADLPTQSAPLEVVLAPPASAAASTPSTGPPQESAAFKIFNIFPLPLGDDLALVLKYQHPNVSDTQRTYQDNIAVIQATVARFPELREAFTTVVARATQPDGKDYGTLVKMADVK
jgi:hypothetical protein